jgi:methyltransferase
MAVTRIAFLVLIGVVGVLRLVELRISRRNERRMIARGGRPAADPSFRWMVLLHAGVLAGAAAEVWLLHRPLIPALAVAMGILFLGANALRWWVIATLGKQWCVEVVDAGGLGVVSSGPFRYVRHPNYDAVFLEMLALPLIYTCWLTALVGTAAHILVLRARVRAEDAVLFANPEYRATMGGKQRFLPWPLRHAPAEKRPTIPGQVVR